jgi:hypothetical protein
MSTLSSKRLARDSPIWKGSRPHARRLRICGCDIDRRCVSLGRDEIRDEIPAQRDVGNARERAAGDDGKRQAFAYPFAGTFERRIRPGSGPSLVDALQPVVRRIHH